MIAEKNEELSCLAELRRRAEEDSEIALGQWLELWYERYIRPTKTPSTANVYLRTIRDHVDGELRSVPVRELALWQFEQYVERQLSQGVAPSTVSQYLGTLCASLNVARDCGLIQENPCKSLRLNRSLRERRPKRSTEPRILNYEDQLRLESAIDLKTEDIGILITLYTGLKAGELLGLYWQDIDLESEEIQITHSRQRLISTGEGSRKTKLELVASSRPRTIAVPEKLAMALRFHRAQMGCGPLQEVPVLHRREQIQCPYEIKQYSRYLKRRGNSSGIPEITLNLLRDTFILRSLERDMDVLRLSEALGTSTSTLYQKYGPYLRLARDNRNTPQSQIFDNFSVLNLQ